MINYASSWPKNAYLMNETNITKPLFGAFSEKKISSWLSFCVQGTLKKYSSLVSGRRSSRTKKFRAPPNKKVIHLLPLKAANTVSRINLNYMYIINIHVRNSVEDSQLQTTIFIDELINGTTVFHHCLILLCLLCENLWRYWIGLHLVYYALFFVKLLHLCVVLPCVADCASCTYFMIMTNNGVTNNIGWPTVRHFHARLHDKKYTVHIQLHRMIHLYF